MNKVNIYTNEYQKIPMFDFVTEKTKEEIINEIFKAKIYACQFANAFVAINTEKIIYITIEEVK